MKNLNFRNSHSTWCLKLFYKVGKIAFECFTFNQIIELFMKFLKNCISKVTFNLNFLKITFQKLQFFFPFLKTGKNNLFVFQMIKNDKNIFL